MEEGGRVARTCNLRDVAHEEYMNMNKKKVASCQISARNINYRYRAT